MIETLKRFVTRIRTGGAGAAAAPAVDGTRADAERLCIEGAQHLMAGRLPDAEASLARALELRHDYAEALLLQGLVCKAHGRFEDATDSFVLAAHFKPDLAEVQFQLGLMAVAQGQSGEAERCLRRAVEADPRHAKAHNELGAVLFRSGALQDAQECFRQAVAIEPGYGQAHSNLGCLLATRLEAWEEGAAHIEAAWRLEPHNQDVQCNWALLLLERGHLSEALALLTRLVEQGKDPEKARLNRALLLLKQGDFAPGWADYEARKLTESEYVAREFPFPEWKGGPLAGRTVLVHAEQGVGDQIMFASCVPDLAQLADRCVIECAPKLAKLFRRSFPAAKIVIDGDIASGEGWLAQSPAIDCQVAIGSLPLHFRSSAADFPAHNGYLRADPGRIAAWRQRLDLLSGALKVGISWRGGTKQSRLSLRSIPLDAWLPILKQDGIAFISLQYTDCRAELADLDRDHGVRVHHWQEAIDDYDETAALACALDLVISVQTALVHLGGALGRPVWVLVPAVSEWRYLVAGETLPWYPSARLFRQTVAGEWSAVIDRVGADLRLRQSLLP